MQQLELPRDSDIRIETRPDLFDGVVTLTADGPAAFGRRLGRGAIPHRATSREAGKLTALPYYLWNNREKGSMQVWIHEA